MVKVENVNKYFNRHKKNEIHAINNTTLEMGKTGLVAILGESGSGKTTLLNAIGGLDKVNKGKIFVNGKKINSMFSSTTDKIRNLNIGYIFQKFLLIDEMTIFENVALVLRMQGIKDKKEIEKRVEYVLEKVGMETYKYRYPTMLSGGQKQRVAIARAIVKNPNVIIADEPTGNLDSKNSLEVMKIIKTISKEKLVILVTHEKDLANFFATRIIDIVDGKVVNDRDNSMAEDLDYRLDSKIYLKDMDISKRCKTDQINIDYYSDANENLDVKIVVRNGNIYIKSNTNKKIEVVDENSSVELLDEHYKKITKEEEEYNYDLDSMVDKNRKLRYKSIYNIFTLTHYGFKKVFRYPFMKKVLLLGFLASAMFVSYSVYNIFGITNIKEEKFIKQEKNDVEVILENSDINKYNEISKIEGLNSIVPGKAFRTFTINFDTFEQFLDNSLPLNLSLASKDILNKEDILVGRLPENNREVVIDNISALRMITYYHTKTMGVAEPKDFIGLKLTLRTYGNLEIVGIANKTSRCVYVAKEEIPSIVYYSKTPEYSDSMGFIPETNTDSLGEEKIAHYDLFKDKLKILEGRAPTNDYEAVVEINQKEIYESKIKDKEKDKEKNKKKDKDKKKEVNIETDIKINGKNLKIVGYYKSQTGFSKLLVNNNTMDQKIISESKIYTVNAKDKFKVLSGVTKLKLNPIDIYAKDREEYVNKMRKTIITTLITSGVVLLISLIEIYLMMRSSFLSRVKEIGVLRAIGVKKKDVRKRFLGEIFAITILASMPGYLVMTYIMNSFKQLPVFEEKYLVNPLSATISLVIIVGANILIGLLPLFKILSKTPAEILSRTDVD